MENGKFSIASLNSFLAGENRGEPGQSIPGHSKEAFSNDLGQLDSIGYKSFLFRIRPSSIR
jgi:hypothetical protein